MPEKQHKGDTSIAHHFCSLVLLCFSSVFVRGSSVLSTDSAASAFWDKYLEFELQQFSTPAVQEQLQLLPPPYTGTLIGSVYAQILSLPLRDIDRFWGSFSSKFAVNYPLNYLASPEEAQSFTAAYPTSVPPERASWVNPADGTTVQVTLTDYVNSWELEARRNLLAKRDYTFRMSLALRDEKLPFESAIARPYFHTAPMGAHELANWSAYLDYMEAKLARAFAAANAAAGGTLELSSETLDPLLLADVIKLFERCLIPCAKYSEFWERYASFVESIGDVARAREIRLRAKAFMQRNAVAGAPSGAVAVAEQNVALAMLEEREGKFEEARALLIEADQPLPASSPAAGSAPAAGASDASLPLLEASLARIHFERRAWLRANPSKTAGAEVRLPFSADNPVLSLCREALARFHPASDLKLTKSYTHLAVHYAQMLLSHVSFSSEADRIKEVRAVFEQAALCMFPEPVTSEVPAPPAAAPPTTDAADGSASSADAAAPATMSVTTQPRLVASRQYAIFWLAYLDFETHVAQSSLDQLSALYERILRTKSAKSATLTDASTSLVGASGLSDESRRQLWSAYATLMEERAPSLAAVEVVRKASKSAMSSPPATSSIGGGGAIGGPPAPVQLLSSLGKRKHTASPLPLASAPAAPYKNPRLGAMPPPQGRAPWQGGYGGGYGAPQPQYGGGGYGGPAAEQYGYQQGAGGYAQQYQ